MRGLALLDASAFWRLSSPSLAADRRHEVSDRITRGLIAASTPLLLETRAGRALPAADPAELPLLRITERAERRAGEMQMQLRAAHQHLGVPPMDYLIAAIAEAHDAALLHYDADFQRLAEHTDLSVIVEPLAPLGSLP